MSNATAPVVTVVTICFNAVKEIEATIISVLNQSYPKIDYVVIDGGSTDGTMTKIREFENRISTLISERDKGIYDAMNKGVQLAKGDWVIFMNAGDLFYSDNALGQLLTPSPGNIDIVYGDHQVRYPGGLTRIQASKKISDLWKGMICSHQAMICRTALLRSHPLNIAEPLAADFEFLVQQHRLGKTIEKRNVVVASILADGVSDRARAKVFRSYFKVVSKPTLTTKALGYYSAMIFFNSFIQYAKKLLPMQLWERLVSLKHNIRNPR